MRASAHVRRSLPNIKGRFWILALFALVKADGGLKVPQATGQARRRRVEAAMSFVANTVFDVC